MLEDYRNITGQYDKLVSIEMIEAVGHKYYGTYFSKCSSLLKHNRLMVIQAITIAEQRYEQAKKSVDFIATSIIMHARLERWPSGLRRSPAKGVWINVHRGFESLPLRQK